MSKMAFASGALIAAIALTSQALFTSQAVAAPNDHRTVRTQPVTRDSEAARSGRQQGAVAAGGSHLNEAV
jgi:hypothetical protein